jgi:hypothetical protein
MNPQGAIEPIASGYRSSSALERGAFTILSACSASIGVARAITFAMERGRRTPRLRKLGRKAYHAPGGEQLRIHHFVPGMFISLVAGAVAILARDDGRERWLGPAFGIGTGLTLDELALLVRLDNPYWGKQTLALTEACAAAIGAIVMAIRFGQKGRSLEPRHETRSD